MWKKGVQYDARTYMANCLLQRREPFWIWYDLIGCLFTTIVSSKYSCPVCQLGAFQAKSCFHTTPRVYFFPKTTSRRIAHLPPGSRCTDLNSVFSYGPNQSTNLSPRVCNICRLCFLLVDERLCNLYASLYYRNAKTPLIENALKMQGKSWSSQSLCHHCMRMHTVQMWSTTRRQIDILCTHFNCDVWRQKGRWHIATCIAFISR